MPIDRCTVVKSGISQQVELVTASLIGLLHDALSLPGKMLAQQGQYGIHRIRRKEKLPWRGILPARVAAKIVPVAHHERILPAGPLLPEAVA